MIVRHLKIHNYRNFSSFEIELKKFTLIIGENNIGKTNLLSAIGMIFSQEVTFFKKRQLELEDINFNAVDKFKSDVAACKIKAGEIDFPFVMIEVLLENFDNNLDQEAIVSDWFVDKELKTAKLTYLFSKRKDLTKWIEEQRAIISALEMMTNDFGETTETDIEFFERKKKLIDFPIKDYDYTIFGGLDSTKRVDNYFLKMLKFEFLDALRDAKTELIANKDHRLLFKILNNRPSNKFEEIKLKLLSLNDAVEKNPELKIVQDQISEYLKKFSLDYDGNNKVAFQFSNIEESELLKKLCLIYGANPINIERNGLGRNNLLYISLLVSHLTNSHNNNNSVFFRLIGIEEPEAHLHPHLQQHLSKNILNEANDDLQIIITSHSTHITSKLDLENTAVVFYDAELGTHKAHYIMSGFENQKGVINKEGRDVQRYLKRYLDATKSTIFFSRKIILVEGISEQILIPKLFELHTNKTLEEVGCCIVNVNGVSFKHFLELIKNGYFIKCLVLTDSDRNTFTEDRASELKDKYEKMAPNVICIKISDLSTFEKDIIRSNSKGHGKETVLNAIEKTRPVLGKALKDKNQDEIDVEEVFTLIETRNAAGKKEGDYKAEFASDLFDSIIINKDGDNFSIPKYIVEGFDFIISKAKQ